MSYLAISRLAAFDLEEIEHYSTLQWGEEAAARYMAAFEQAFLRIRENPALLREMPEISPDVKFYRVERHFVICSVVEENVYVLTVKHTAMDLPERIGELEPTLRAEVVMLHRSFLKSLGK